MSQAELIKRAFAGDDVQAEFEAVKAAEVEEELPKQVTKVMHFYDLFRAKFMPAFDPCRTQG